MNKFLKLISLSLFFIVIFQTNSYSQKLLTIEEVISHALKNTYSIIISRYQTDILENNVTAGNAGFLPDISADASYTKSRNDTKQEYFDGRAVDRNNAETKNLNAALRLNWTIFDGLRMFAELNRFKSIRDEGELNFKLQVENTINEVVNSYYSIIKEQKTLDVNVKNLKLSKERFDILQTEKQIGTASQFDLLQAVVDLNGDSSAVLSQQLKIIQLKNNLLNLLNIDNNDFAVSDTFIFNGNLVYEDLLSAALENNTNILLAKQSINTSRLDVSVARADWFPTINFNTSYNFAKSEAEAGLLKSNQSLGFQYGVTASLSLFNGLNTARQIENANVELKIQELNLKDVSQSVSTELNNAYQSYVSSLRLINLEKENRKAAEQNVNFALERLHLGTITPIEFRKVQQDLLAADNRLYNSMYETKIAENNLLRLSGQLLKSY